MKKLLLAMTLTLIAAPAFASHPCKSDVICSPEVQKQTKRMQLPEQQH